MNINLRPYQQTSIDKLKSGAILVGGVGSGKSRTAIAYYFIKECGGRIKINNRGHFKPMSKPKDLYIITTAKKRDSLEFEEECAPFSLSTKSELNTKNIKVTIDSWNNIAKYKDVTNSFFIFDEQRLVGSGKWVKSFLKIAKSNNWILLSATPGDTWGDYIPVFIANGFYKNRTEFLRRHAVFSRFTKYPKVEKYIDTAHLYKLRSQISIIMHYDKATINVNKPKLAQYDKESFDSALKKRWNPIDNTPIRSITELGYILRKIVNRDPSRTTIIKEIMKDHPKVIIFYNFDYELEILKRLGHDLKVPTSEWNGHAHKPIPDTDNWIYLVQYTAGAEGWNCIETDTIIFYSQNYSYKTMVQAAGRIDRLNTPFEYLYYYHIRSASPIDLAISKSLKEKKDFNILKFIKE